FKSVLRQATSTEKTNPLLGQKLVDWQHTTLVYDSGIALIWLHEAKKGDWIADQVLCKAASILLWETSTISDVQLRAYAAERLCGDRQISDKKKRGRRATDNSYRDHIIGLYLIPPLLSMGFHATRSDASKTKVETPESACSIVCSALKMLCIHLSEK